MDARQRSPRLQEPKFAQKSAESRRFPPVAGENALRTRLIFGINEDAENFISLKLHQHFFFARILNTNPNAYFILLTDPNWIPSAPGEI